MKINWCYKGIAESPYFNDLAAGDVLLKTGILSVWMLKNAGLPLNQANIDAQSALSASALDTHVNNYAVAKSDTPYISLTAGCYEYLGTALRPKLYPARASAVRFATNNGTSPGYLFKCWVVTGLKAAPDIPAVAEDVTNLSIYQNFFRYYRQGEITAKLVVPRRQIESVIKLDKLAKPVLAAWAGGSVKSSVFNNPDFKPPEEMSNLMGAL